LINFFRKASTNASLLLAGRLALARARLRKSLPSSLMNSLTLTLQDFAYDPPVPCEDENENIYVDAVTDVNCELIGLFRKVIPPVELTSKFQGGKSQWPPNMLLYLFRSKLNAEKTRPLMRGLSNLIDANPSQSCKLSELISIPELGKISVFFSNFATDTSCHEEFRRTNEDGELSYKIPCRLGSASFLIIYPLKKREANLCRKILRVG